MIVNRYFTVITNDSGIVDKLAFQMRILYNLGAACGFIYVHTPLAYERSLQSHHFRNITDKIETFLFFNLKLKVPMFIEKIVRQLDRVLSKLDHFFNKYIDWRKHDTLNKFLGLDDFNNRVNEKKFSRYSIVDVPLKEIVTNNNITTLEKFKEVLESHIIEAENVIYSFSSERIYHHLADLAKILANSRIDVSNYQYLSFSEKYWRVKDRSVLHSPFQEGKLKVVIHIRRGDSVVVDLGSQKIYVHGDVTTYDEFQGVLKIDSGREIVLDEYKPIVRKIFQEFGETNISCVVISDGYELTFRRIVRAISRGQLRLKHDELEMVRQLHRSATEEPTELLNYQDVSYIIGETNSNLVKSIHALACADVVIYGSIGFSFGVHKLFRKNMSSVMIDVKNKHDDYLDGITTMIAAIK
ncbi:MAG: hypothetical protein JWQ28_2348 [Pedobacter sp.]|nr:hypothetical protein [Pedobacter sp.]